ncbi:hypothetical protein ACHAW6_000672 [Cyclotella cf. meneghiniana]
MAALLCETISKIIHGTCDACGTVLSLPCKACGIATDQLTNVCRSPFCLFLSVAIGLNLPPVIFTAKSSGGGYDYDEGCTSAAKWIYVNGALCIVHMMAALYMSNKISQEPGEVNDTPFVKASVMDHETGNGQNPKKTLVKMVMENTMPTQSRSVARVKEILCYDPFVALYIIISIFFMAWQTVGVGRSSLAVDCGGGLDENITYSLICGFLFIFLGGSTFACSLCCLFR